MVCHLIPDVNFVELFARSSPGSGWSTAISNQAGLLDNGKVETRRWTSSNKATIEETSP